MVKELQSNKETYVGFVHELEKYEESDRQFLQPGVFLGDTGDFMAKATVNLLRMPVILLTSIENYPITNVTPDEFAEGCDNVCVFIAYSRGGPGHCDALIERRGGMEEVGKTRSVESSDVCPKPPKCTCEIKNKELKSVCCNPESASRQYASRYPCLRLEQ